MTRATRISVALAAMALCIAYNGTATAQSTGLTHDEAKSIRLAVDLHDQHLRTLYDLIEDLRYAADESSNANRRKAINAIHELMAQVILQMEAEIGKNHVIIEHGQNTYTDEREAKGQSAYTSTAEKNEFRNDIQTGGVTPGKYWIHRLTQMQSVYRVCATAREPAISKHDNGLPFFIDKSAEFARLMETNIGDALAMLPGAETDEKPASEDKYQARKSKYE